MATFGAQITSFNASRRWCRSNKETPYRTHARTHSSRGAVWTCDATQSGESETEHDAMALAYPPRRAPRIFEFGGSAENSPNLAAPRHIERPPAPAPVLLARTTTSPAHLPLSPTTHAGKIASQPQHAHTRCEAKRFLPATLEITPFVVRAYAVCVLGRCDADADVAYVQALCA